MGYLIINTQKVSAAADIISGLNKQIRDEFEDTVRKIEGYLGEWTSSASEVAMDKWRQIVNSYTDDRYNVLDNYVNFLRNQVTAGYEEVEKTNISLAERFRQFEPERRSSNIGVSGQRVNTSSYSSSGYYHNGGGSSSYSSGTRISKDSYSYSGNNYKVLDGFENYTLVQPTSQSCTSTAWVYGLSVMGERKYSAGDAISASFWSEEDGCLWSGSSGSIFLSETGGNYNEMLRRAYSELQQGKSSVFYATRPFGAGYHAVSIVGVKENVNPGMPTIHDFLVMDPADGVIKCLDEVGYDEVTSYGRLVMY